MRWSSVTVAVAVMPAYRLSSTAPAARMPRLHRSAKSTAFCSRSPWFTFRLRRVCITSFPAVGRAHTCNARSSGSASILRHSACAMAFCGMMCSTVYSLKDRGSLGWLWFSNPPSRYLHRGAGRYKSSPSSACLNCSSVGMRVALAVSVSSSAAKVSTKSCSADSSLAIRDGTSLFNPLLDTEQIILRNRYDSRSASMRSSPSQLTRSRFHAANMSITNGSVTVLTSF